MQTWRVTMTAPLVNNAARVAFLVAGQGKSDIVSNVLSGPFRPDVRPAYPIAPTPGGPTWLPDRAAAAGVEP